MLTIDEIRRRLAGGQSRLSDHALSRVVERNIPAETIREAGVNAELVEDFPADKYSPSCLLLGFASDGLPLHWHVSRAENPDVKIVTLYVPDPEEWYDYRVRRSAP